MIPVSDEAGIDLLRSPLARAVPLKAELALNNLQIPWLKTSVAK